MALLRQRIGDLADTFLKYHLNQQQGDRENQMLMERQSQLSQQNAAQAILSKVASNPAFALQLEQQGIDNVGGIPIGTFAATGSDFNAPIVKQISEAKTPEELPSIQALMAERRAAGPVITQTDASGMSSLPDLQAFSDLMSARQGQADKLTQDQANAVTHTQDTSRAAAYGQGVGANQAEGETFNDKMGRSLLLGRQNNQLDVEKEQALSPVMTSRAAAEEAVRAKFTMGATFFDDQGNAHEVKMVNGRMVDTPLPPGYTNQKPQQLSAPQIDELSSLNTAETEGVKVLAQLKQSGLADSNDPTDPRWTTFAITTLKINPNDWNQADLTQRTQFVKAALLRGLMGGRPSRAVMDLFAEHMPDSKQTGSLLYHEMNNVLQQVNSRRTEMENLSGHKPGALAPSSGTSYQQWLTLPGNNDNQPAQPNPNIALTPGLDHIMGR